MSPDYLIIEPFLQDALQARTLQAAFDLGIIDVVAECGELPQSEVFRNRACDAAGARFLVEVLSKAGVFHVTEQRIGLTPGFRDALRFRELLQTKLRFAELVAPDFFSRLPQLLSSSEEFMSTSKLFELFDYGRCHDVTPQNCLQASRWMQLTTMLTRYEAPVCCDHFAFDEHRRMLDLGGNSGEFALQACRRVPALHATIADLPVVCHVGARHVAAFPEAARIQFQPMHFIEDAFPGGHDLITCKSVLHDWPDSLVEVLVRKCFDSLPADGRILIFERQLWDMSLHAMPYGLLPVLLFFRSYRRPEFYTTLLNAVGFTEVIATTIQLEVPFMLVTGKASGGRESPDTVAGDTSAKSICPSSPVDRVHPTWA